jgi:hypothetical protein
MDLGEAYEELAVALRRLTAALAAREAASAPSAEYRAAIRALGVAWHRHRVALAHVERLRQQPNGSGRRDEPGRPRHPRQTGHL